MDQEITALRLQERNRHRVNVFLDGKYAFGLSRVLAAQLHSGQFLSSESIDDLLVKDTQEVAYQKALRFISYRPRSEMEVRKKLASGNIESGTIDELLDRLRESKLVNDEEFTQNWIENRNQFRPRGGHLLGIELRKKGIADEIIQQSLETLDEEALALKAAQKFTGRLTKLDWPNFRRKLYGYLARRGFDYSVINSTINGVWKSVERKISESNELSPDLDSVQENEVI